MQLPRCRLPVLILAAVALAMPASSYTLLHEHSQDGASPYATLVSDGAGNLYGTTWAGGLYNAGTVFRLRTDGTGFVVLHSFDGAYRGRNPGSELLLDSAGWLYGTTYAGGASGLGTVFRLGTDGSGFQDLKDFEGFDGSTPQGGLVSDGAGNLYGTTTQGGSSNFGTVFKLSTDGVTFAVVHSFSGGASDGQLPYSSLTLDGSGTLYGTTYRGGTSNLGTAFRVQTDGTGFALLHSFVAGATDGTYPQARLTLDGSGNLFGTTTSGGPSNSGIVFTLKTDGTGFALLHGFSGGAAGGGVPYAGVVLDESGNLFGTTSQGGAANAGTVFTLRTDGTGFAVVHSFTNGAADGGTPYASLVRDSAGRLYGTASGGGAWNLGTVFAVNADGTGFTLLHAFLGSALDGSVPFSELVVDDSGNLYGTTQSGGTSNLGTVFRMKTDGTGFTILHAFAGGANDGNAPRCQLVLDGSGNLYGTTTKGGASNLGTVFTLKTDGTAFALLHSFAGTPTDGSEPEAGLVLGDYGYLYGTTYYGGGLAGAMGGTVFTLKTDGTGYSLLHTFYATLWGTSHPRTRLVFDGVSGTLYGTADASACWMGGCTTKGIIFKIDGGGYSEIPVPTPQLGGSAHLGALVLDGAYFYGTAVVDILSFVYRIRTDGTDFTKLHDFGGTDGTDGRTAWAGLVLDDSGNLFGTTLYGGISNRGTVYTLKTDGTAFQVLHRFSGSPTDGARPYGGLVRDTDGNLYGTTSAGGSADSGTEYMLPPPLEPGFYPVAPCRLVDTRGAPGPRGGPALSAGETRSFPLAGTCGIPATTRAVALNLTVVTPGSAGYLTAFGAVDRPLASAVSFSDGQTRANNAILALDSQGAINVYAVLLPGMETDLLIDVSGFFE